MEAFTLTGLPFFYVTDRELKAMFCKDTRRTILDNTELYDNIHHRHNGDTLEQIRLNFVTED
jgi:hypothetical protein